MSGGFDYDFDLDNLDEEEVKDVEVERLGTQQQNQKKKSAAAQRQEKQQAAASQKKKEKDQQQQQQQQNQKVQPTLNKANFFKQPAGGQNQQQQQLQQQQAQQQKNSTALFESTLQNLQKENLSSSNNSEMDAHAQMMQALMNNDEDDEDDDEEEFDTNAILGLTSSKKNNNEGGELAAMLGVVADGNNNNNNNNKVKTEPETSTKSRRVHFADDASAVQQPGEVKQEFQQQQQAQEDSAASPNSSQNQNQNQGATSTRAKNKKSTLFVSAVTKQDSSSSANNAEKETDAVASAFSKKGAAAASSSNYAVSAAPSLSFDKTLMLANQGGGGSGPKLEVKLEQADLQQQRQLEEEKLKIEQEALAALRQQGEQQLVKQEGGGQQQQQQQKGIRKPPPTLTEKERSQVPTVNELKNANDIHLKNFYWIDAKEVNSTSAPQQQQQQQQQQNQNNKNNNQNNNALLDSINGCVLLFGRIAVRENPNAPASYKSVCVRVPMTRCVMILPKASSTSNIKNEGGENNNNNNSNNSSDLDIIREATQFCRRKGIDERTFKFVNRMYAFEEPGVPTEETRWLKLRYSAAYPALLGYGENLPRFQHIQNMFGINRSLLELLLVKRRFEGPGFLDITHATAVSEQHKKSLCDFEFVTTTQKNVFVLDAADVRGIPPPPKLTACSLHLRTQLDQTGKCHEVYAATIALTTIDSENSAAATPECIPVIGIRQWNNTTVLPFELVGRCAQNGFKNVRTFMSEQQLIRWVLETLREQDPDIIIGHNLTGFSLGVLFNRIAELRPTPTWSTMGRLNWRSMPPALTGRNFNLHASNKTFWEKEVCCGRLIVDTYTLAKEYHRTSSYKLLGLARELEINGVFGPVLESHVEQAPVILDAAKMNKDANELCFVLGQDYNHALLCVRLSHKLGLVPLTKRLAVVAGTVWSRVLNGSRAERIEYLLTHAFHRLKFVTPDKKNNSNNFQQQQQQQNNAAAAAAEQEKQRLAQAAQQNQRRRGRRGGAAAASAAVANILGEAEGTGGANGAEADIDPNNNNNNEEDDIDDLIMDEDEENNKDDEDGVFGGATSAAGGGGTNKKGAKFKGGRVLEPKVGLYRDYILLLDFNSLYPSLIQEFNVCFTTVERTKLGSNPPPNAIDRTEPVPPSRDRLICEKCIKLPNALETMVPCPHRGILPRVIRDLVQRRRAVRNMMKTERNPAHLAQHEITQKALKLTANSMYGCLGFSQSRFYAQKLAELVTQEGRRALQSTVNIVNSNAFDLSGNVNTNENSASAGSPSYTGRVQVIYGDTDSVMISTGEYESLDVVKRIAAAIQKEVNKRYRCLELGMDGVFRTLLLHKKKKYAGLAITDFNGAGRTFKQEVKGLEMVRRDWCKLSKEACNRVLATALSPQFASDDEVVETIGNALERIADTIVAGKQQLSNFVIAKSIQRDPAAYKDANTQPHVQVALRMQERKLPVHPGDLIPYVICDPNSAENFHLAREKEKEQKNNASNNNNSNNNNSAAPTQPSAASASSNTTAATSADSAAATASSPAGVGVKQEEKQSPDENKNNNNNEDGGEDAQQQQNQEQKTKEEQEKQKQDAKSKKEAAQHNRFVKSLASRAFHEEEVKESFSSGKNQQQQQQQQQVKQENASQNNSQTEKQEKAPLLVDNEWYLANQLYPPVLRLCEHIPGFTPAFLCDKLKLTKQAVGLHDENDNNNNNNNNNKKRFWNNKPRSDFSVAFKEQTLEDMFPSDVSRFHITCTNCGMREPHMLHERARKLINKEIDEPNAAEMSKNPALVRKFLDRATDRGGSSNYYLRRIPWFICANKECRATYMMAPSVVENTLLHQLSLAVQNFYSSSSSSSINPPPNSAAAASIPNQPEQKKKNARSTEKYEKLLEEFSYLTRLFDIPPHPLTAEERYIWDRAARFVDTKGRWRNAEEIREQTVKLQKHEDFLARLQRTGGNYESLSDADAVVAGGAFASEVELNTAREIVGSKRIGQAVLEKFLPLFPSLNVDLGDLFPAEYESS